MENRKFDDQLANTGETALTPGPFPIERGEDAHPALRLIRMKPELFAAQGHVAETWRRRDGKKFGPYYRLSYRLGGRQHSIYLGRASELVIRVRRELEAVQMPLLQRRIFRSLERRIRASLRVHKMRVSALLRPYGLRLKGYEVRGWRYSPLRYVIPRRRLLPRTLPQRLLSPMQRHLEPQKRLMRYLEARDGKRPPEKIALPWSRTIVSGEGEEREERGASGINRFDREGNTTTKTQSHKGTKAQRILTKR